MGLVFYLSIAKNKMSKICSLHENEKQLQVQIKRHITSSYIACILFCLVTFLPNSAQQSSVYYDPKINIAIVFTLSTFTSVSNFMRINHDVCKSAFWDIVR